MKKRKSEFSFLDVLKSGVLATKFAMPLDYLFALCFQIIQDHEKGLSVESHVRRLRDRLHELGIHVQSARG